MADKDLHKEIERLNKENLMLKHSVKNKNYGLVWMNIEEAFGEEAENRIPVLKEVVDYEVKNDTDKPTHILIEGDNYHALTCLNYTHMGKIDVIYIDPPYNTGKDGFRYKDKRIINKYPDGTEVPKDHPFRHSYWLSFMKKRLELARNLLSDTGVIIVHIDENEVANLIHLMNDIFDAKNDLGIIVWNKKNPKGDSKGISIMHEYILCYAKNKEEFLKLDGALKRKKPNAVKILNKAKRLYSKLGKRQIPEEVREVIKPFNYPEEILKDFEVEYDLETINREFQNWLRRQDFSGGEKAYKYIDEKGEVYRGVSMSWPSKKTAPPEFFEPLIHPVTGKECPVPKRGWRYTPETMKKLLEQNLILFGEDEKKQPERKYYLKENMYENTPSILEYAGSDDDYFEKMELEFPYAKPVAVAKYLLTSIHPNPKIILDFFAGSGTTGHAVLEINEEEDDEKQFILVSNNENNIMTDVCYPRIKSIISKTSNSLKYYKTAFVGENNILNASDEDRIELAYNAGELLSIAENTLYLMEKNEFYQIYTDYRNRFTAVYFREELDMFEEFTMKINELQGETIVYMFSWGSNEFSDYFQEKDNVTVKSIPQPILEIYSKIYNL